MLKCNCVKYNDRNMPSMRTFDYRNKNNSVSIKYDDKSTKLKVILVSKEWIVCNIFLGKFKKRKKYKKMFM